MIIHRELYSLFYRFLVGVAGEWGFQAGVLVKQGHRPMTNNYECHQIT